jgi:hypothetical protein
MWKNCPAELLHGAREAQTSLPACLMILDVIGDLLADGRQIEELLLDKGIFGLFGKFSIHGRLLPKIFIPVHASSYPARP